MTAFDLSDFQGCGFFVFHQVLSMETWRQQKGRPDGGCLKNDRPRGNESGHVSVSGGVMMLWTASAFQCGVWAVWPRQWAPC